MDFRIKRNKQTADKIDYTLIRLIHNKEIWDIKKIHNFNTSLKSAKFKDHKILIAKIIYFPPFNKTILF